MLLVKRVAFPLQFIVMESTGNHQPGVKRLPKQAQRLQHHQDTAALGQGTDMDHYRGAVWS